MNPQDRERLLAELERLSVRLATIYSSDPEGDKLRARSEEIREILTVDRRRAASGR